MAERLTPRKRKRKRIHMMLWAYLHFSAKKIPPDYYRARLSWLCLLEWAYLGGTPDEVIHG